MLNYFFKLLILVLFSCLIAFFYYTLEPSHIENFDWYIYYLIPLIIFYSIYKYIKCINRWENIYFSLPEIVWYFLLNLFLLSLVFFTISWWDNFTAIFWVNLFFKIILYSIVPILIIFISISFWRKILKQINLFWDENNYNIFNFLLSLWIGFFSFLFLLTIIWFLGFYNLYIVLVILLLFILISRVEILELWSGFLSYRIKFENHNFETKDLIKNIALKLISTEFLFILASILLSINLINIVRPMPIWWDDLWVYMNFPRQMAHSGMIDFLWWMYSWQIFTWIWYMISEPTQAFFLNSVWWFLSFIVIILIISDLLSNIKSKTKTLINIPLLSSIIFISMPMVVFQQAKDMKLDEWLFFISIIVFYLIAKIFINYNNKDIVEEDNFLSSKKNILKFIFIAWILSWFAFTLKFTSLLLISGLIGVIFFVKIWIAWFLWYLWIYFAIFTKAWLWSYLNVIYPKENINLINIFSIISAVLWLVFLSIWFLKYKKEIWNLFKYILIFLLGILIAILPWLWKNINQAITSDTKINIWVLLSWKGELLDVNLNNIYTQEELDNISKIEEDKILNNSWAIKNEDLERYIGYEKGINNFVNLPWNLTMQVNQKWEFTNIWWLFLALLPAILLFLKFRIRYLEYFILLLLLLETLIFVIPSSRELFTNLMNNINLPWGYLVILLLFLIPLFYFIFLLKWDKKNNLFKINIIFATFYIFLFVISAYWIVWYWIVMYFSLILMIAIAIYNISSYKDDSLDKIRYTKLFWSLALLSIFLLYFFLSTIPYSFNNLKLASYANFKAWTINFEEAIFAYHPEYKTILSTLNLDKNKENEIIKSVFNLENKNEKLIYDLIIKNKLNLDDTIKLLDEINFWLFDEILLNNLGLNENNLILIKNSSKNIRIKLFRIILKPDSSFKNTGNVYRIWTFLKYYIVDNNKRLLWDNLIEFFPKYLYDENSYSNTVERIKKLWFKYLLVDLNAATIDNDPRHDLTRRYEGLLKTFTNENLKLIESDSLCLKLSLDNYSKSDKTDKDISDYLNLGWVNHESYIENNTKVILRWSKLKNCYFEIAKLLTKGNIDENNYPYLLPIYNEYNSLVKDKKIKTEEDIYKYLNIRVRNWSKVLFEIN